MTWASIITCAGMLLSIWLVLHISGLHFDFILTSVKQYARDFTSTIVEQGAESMFFGTMTADQYTAYLQDLIVRYLPSIIFIAAMITAMFCYLLCSAVMRRLCLNIKRLPPFSNWRIDWRLMWAIVAALLVAGCGGFLEIQLLKDIGNNILIVFFPILFVCGLSFLVWLLRNIHMPLWIMIFIILICFQFSLTLLIMIFLGAFDAVFNFRMRITNFRDKIDKGEF